MERITLNLDELKRRIVKSKHMAKILSDYAGPFSLTVEIDIDDIAVVLAVSRDDQTQFPEKIQVDKETYVLTVDRRLSPKSLEALKN